MRAGRAVWLWQLAAWSAAATGALWFFDLAGAGLPTLGPSLPWWALAIGFAVAEAGVVQVRVRGSPYDVGFGESVLVLGLFTARPALVLLAQVVGGGVVLLARGQHPAKFAFNLGRIAVSTAAGLAVFGPVAVTADIDDPRPWGAALLAALIAVAIGFLATVVAVRTVEGPMSLDESAIAAVTNLAALVVAVGLGLAVAGVVGQRPLAGVFFLPVAAVLLAVRFAARSRPASRGQSMTLASLMRLADRAADEDAAAQAVLAPTLRALGAETAELLRAPIVEGEPARLLRMAAGRGGTLVDLADDDPMLAAMGAVGAAMTVGRASYAEAPAAVRRYLADRGWVDAVLAPVGLAGRHSGLLVVAGRAGAAELGDADTQTVTAAAQAAGSIESSRLQRSLAEMLGRQHELEHRAYHDGLSGLANRGLFLDRVGQALARRPDPGGGDQVGVLLIDLDNLKLVNDSLGHQAGDELLVVVAERIEGCARVGDTAARLSGDEFAVLLPRVADSEQAMLVAQRLLDVLAEPLFLAGQQLPVSASIGVAVVPPKSVEASELVRRADIAMYAAKRAGKGRCERYDDGLAASRDERRAFGGALPGAVLRGEIEVHYQPYVELATGEVAGYEAMMRWRHPRHGLVMPAQFLPEAVDSGAIIEIGAYVLATACRQLAEWQRDGLATGMLLSVNVSGREIADPGFLSVVVDALTSSGLPAHWLVLEVAERVLTEDFPAVVEALDAVAEQGVRWTVDDFGT